MELADTNKAQISRFVTHFRGMREGLLKESEQEANDFKSDRLSNDGDIFNTSDVTDLVDAYHAQMITCIRQSMDSMINRSAVFISQLLAQAQAAGLSIEPIDFASIDDQQSGDIMTLVSQGMALAPMTRKVATLPTLAGAPVGPDPATAAKMRELEEENNLMRERYQLMQAEVASLLSARASLSQELDKVRSQVAVMQQTSSDANLVEIERTLGDTKVMLDAKQAECEQMKRDLGTRVSDTTQFKELKSIVKKKSEEVKALRRRLADHGLPFTTNEGVELAPEDD
jgi:hypothetical protein|eukprot:TRINITY_DN74198_c0_g1_i1.p1 TRINITY_DN74198_c0_g1~~TRINITY_DN74198_c0_g1_i1.p1  ORF type:complete len:317 (+),score=68.88 TRINITY_DN74198_c0_g1_i1:99-953(+)